MIRPLKKDDDLPKVASLIYECDEEMMSILFGKKEKALERIKALILKEHNSLSYRNIYCYYDDEIKGIVVNYAFGKENDKLSGKDYIDALPLWFILKMSIVYSRIDKLITKRDSGHYIECLCVEKESRSEGIGERLINYVASSIDSKELYLDVSAYNEKAIRFYNRVGFNTVERKETKEGLCTYTMLKTL